MSILLFFLIFFSFFFLPVSRDAFRPIKSIGSCWNNFTLFNFKLGLGEQSNHKILRLTRWARYNKNTKIIFYDLDIFLLCLKTS
jgi:hypothetical protein